MKIAKEWRSTVVATVFMLLAWILLIVLLTTGKAQGQQYVRTEPAAVFNGNPQHADVHPMAIEQSLLNGPNLTSASGERPMWEFGKKTPDYTLGKTAKDYRAAHASAPKSKVVYVN
jgi:hypothetical protein